METILNKESRAAIELMIADGIIAKDAAERYFPELKESEDERIITGLNNCLKWLEEEARWDNVGGCSFKDVYAWLEKQGEQKPTEWSKEDEKMIKNIIYDLDYLEKECCNDHYEGSRDRNPYHYSELINWLKSLKDRVQPKQEWSKEDERIYQSIMDDTVQENQLDDKQTNWLRDIKYRYFPQPKQEWSKEDENTVASIISSLSNPQLYPPTIHDIEWLKFLKDRYIWKPSDEQMEALNRAQAELCSTEYNKPICDLIDSLKKLREK